MIDARIIENNKNNVHTYTRYTILSCMCTLTNKTWTTSNHTVVMRTSVTLSLQLVSYFFVVTMRWYKQRCDVISFLGCQSTHTHTAKWNVFGKHLILLLLDRNLDELKQSYELRIEKMKHEAESAVKHAMAEADKVAASVKTLYESQVHSSHSLSLERFFQILP